MAQKYSFFPYLATTLLLSILLGLLYEINLTSEINDTVTDDNICQVAHNWLEREQADLDLPVTVHIQVGVDENEGGILSVPCS